LSFLMRGKLIVFEGIDSSGKATQQGMLIESLKQKGFSVEALDFPRYSEFFGSLVGRYLAGEFGAIDEVPAEFASLIYSIDRYQLKKEIEQKLSAGTILVANRYVFSNIAFQSEKFRSLKEKKEFMEWLSIVESRMPEADIVFFLDIPVKTAVSLMAGKDRLKSYRNGKERDMHESDDAYLERVRENYLSLAQKHTNWKVTGCVEKDCLKNREEIAKEVLALASRFLKI